jgi:hypothetical protein
MPEVWLDGTMGAVRKETERLVRQARRDVENERKVIATGAYEVTACLSQQAVGKFLQASGSRRCEPGRPQPNPCVSSPRGWVFLPSFFPASTT